MGRNTAKKGTKASFEPPDDPLEPPEDPPAAPPTPSPVPPTPIWTIRGDVTGSPVMNVFVRRNGARESANAEPIAARRLQSFERAVSRSSGSRTVKRTAASPGLIHVVRPTAE